MANSQSKNYQIDLSTCFQYCRKAIKELKYKISVDDEESGFLKFNTGISLWSWTGQTVALDIIEIKDGNTRISLHSHNDSIQLYDWGESNKVTRKFFEKLDELIKENK